MNRFDVEFKLNKIDFSNENDERAQYIIYEYLNNKYGIKESSSNFVFNYCYYINMDSDFPSYTKIFSDCIKLVEFIKEFNEYEDREY